MDILDEVDAAVREKRSKWKYTPMREKSETERYNRRTAA